VITAEEFDREKAKILAGGSQNDAVDKIAKLADLRERGVITAEEFDREKAKILALLPRSSPSS
jgi:predicted ATPase